jgi:hypothetical protein
VEEWDGRHWVKDRRERIWVDLGHKIGDCGRKLILDIGYKFGRNEEDPCSEV